MKLIPRLYDPLFGSVLIDGVDVKKYKVDELRAMIGYVPQKNVLFSGDIASNLNFGKESGTELEWKYAANIACADEFIEKKEKGYHDGITQGGDEPFRRSEAENGDCQSDHEISRDLCI